MKDECITENIMQTLTKYSNMEHEDWDMHLPAVIYRINTTKHVGVLFFLNIYE